jgi:hypothetical protein
VAQRTGAELASAVAAAAAPSAAPPLSWRRLGPAGSADAPAPAPLSTPVGWAPPARSAAEHAHLAALAALAFDDWLAAEGDTTACGPANVPAVGVTVTAACVKEGNEENENENENEGPRALYSLEFRARFACGALSPSDVAVTATLRAVVDAAPLAVAEADAPHAPPAVRSVWLAGGWQDSATLVASTKRTALVPSEVASSSSAPPPVPADAVVYDGAASAAAVEARAEEEAVAAVEQQERDAAAVAEALALSAALSRAAARAAEEQERQQQQQQLLQEQQAAGGEVASLEGMESFRANDLGINWAAQAGGNDASDLSMPAGGSEDDGSGGEADASVASTEQQWPAEGEADAAQEPAAQAADGAADADADPATTTGDATAAEGSNDEWSYRGSSSSPTAADAAAAMVAAGDTAAVLAADDATIDAAVAASLAGSGGGADDLTDAELWAVGVDPADRTRFWTQRGQSQGKPTE